MHCFSPITHDGKTFQAGFFSSQNLACKDVSSLEKSHHTSAPLRVTTSLFKPISRRFQTSSRIANSTHMIPRNIIGALASFYEGRRESMAIQRKKLEKKRKTWSSVALPPPFKFPSFYPREYSHLSDRHMYVHPTSRIPLACPPVEKCLALSPFPLASLRT